MTKSDKERLQSSINDEGLDYTFVEKSLWDEIDDFDFHLRRFAFLAARRDLVEYLKKSGVEINE